MYICSCINFTYVSSYNGLLRISKKFLLTSTYICIHNYCRKYIRTAHTYKNVIFYQQSTIAVRICDYINYLQNLTSSHTYFTLSQTWDRKNTLCKFRLACRIPRLAMVQLTSHYKQQLGSYDDLKLKNRPKFVCEMVRFLQIRTIT